MKELILSRLREIEEKEQVRILLAVESGSRAWGFASPDSDYDVRFLYVRPVQAYLQLCPERDVLEYPIEGELDLNGWDLSKALKLIYKSNPILFEWLASPVVYWDSPFRQAVQPLLKDYFSSKSAVHHYLCLAENHDQVYLQGEQIRLKKFFYTLRAVLACRWILTRKSPPPVPFRELMAETLEPSLRPEMERLLALKCQVTESDLVPRVEVLDRYLEESLAMIRREAEGISRRTPVGWEALDRLFLTELYR